MDLHLRALQVSSPEAPASLSLGVKLGYEEYLLHRAAMKVGTVGLLKSHY